MSTCRVPGLKKPSTPTSTEAARSMLLTSVIVALATAMMMPPKPSMAPSPRCQASRCTAVAGEEADFLEDAEIFADTVASFAAIDLNGDGYDSGAALFACPVVASNSLSSLLTRSCLPCLPVCLPCPDGPSNSAFSQGDQPR